MDWSLFRGEGNIMFGTDSWQKVMMMKQAKVLTQQELRRVLAMCEAMQNGKRNRVAVLLSHYGGLRVGELASLKWSDVLNADGTVKDQFWLKAENTKSDEARAVHLNAR